MRISVNNELNNAILMGGLSAGSLACFVGTGSYQSASSRIGDRPGLIAIKSDSVIGVSTGGETGIVVSPNNLGSTKYIIKF